MKILYISYFYPPLGGPAALRNLKTVSYLSELGCEIDVLTVADIQYSIHDPALGDQCREHSLTRIPSLDPMALLKKLATKSGRNTDPLYHQTPEQIKLRIRRLFPLDDKVLWLPALLKNGRQMLRASHYDYIYVSCGPFSSAVAAYRLSQSFGVPYVLEMRDYWTLLSDYDLLGNALNRAYSRFWEKRLLQSAALIVTATRGIADDYASYYGSHLRAKTFTLFNGHDEADFAFLQDLSALQNHDKMADNTFTISYFGALYARRSLKALLRAMQMPAFRTTVRLKLYGNYHRETLLEIEQSGVQDRVEILPPLEHRAALQHMLASDSLLLVINSGSPRGTLTSKLFEYLRLNKPILALAPENSEAADLLAESGHPAPVPMESSDQIATALQRLIDERYTPHAYHYPAARYERRQQINGLYALLNRTEEALREH